MSSTAKIVTYDNAIEALQCIVPIFKLSFSGEAQLIGTGFFVSRSGLVVTAKHVITDNIGPDGIDMGGIAILHFTSENHVISRPLLISDLHQVCDLALCETTQFKSKDGNVVHNDVLGMTLTPPRIGTQISTHSYHAIDSSTDDEKYKSEFSTKMLGRFNFALDFSKTVPLEFRSRVTAGYLREHYPNGRDGVMLPFPCYRSDMPIYAGTSGGPVFDDRGRVFAVNCTRIEGSDVAYHTDISGILDLRVRNALLPGEDSPRTRTLREIASIPDLLPFDPQ